MSARQIARTALLDRLDGVRGPMGSGKTNLVARWCADRRHVARRPVDPLPARPGAGPGRHQRAAWLPADALAHVAAAIAIAGPERLLQPVLQMGVHVLGPLWQVAQRSDENDARELAEQVAVRLRTSDRAHPSLTVRESLVLHHLASGATFPAIAEQLAVSVNTVKAQVKSIYRKLAAGSRDEAVATWQLLQAEVPGSERPLPSAHPRE